MRGTKFWGLMIVLCMLYGISRGKDFDLHSPDGKIMVKVQVAEKIFYSVNGDGETLLDPSPVSIVIGGRTFPGKGASVVRSTGNQVRQDLHPVIRQKNRVIPNHFNELDIRLDNGFGVVFRVFNDGFAYRIRLDLDDPVQIDNEEVRIHFPGNHLLYFPEEKRFISHQERTYKHISLKQIPDGSTSILPVLVEMENNRKMLITEAHVADYPGMHLSGTGGKALKGIFPGVVLEEGLKRDRDPVVKKRAGYIARTGGHRQLPWRIFVISREDRELASSEMVYRLSPPLRLKDTSWIKPGKVAWDWWNANNIYGVTFESGMNTSTYRYYIDFASDHRIEYVIFDEGWYELGNLLKINPSMDVPGLIRYAEKKNVGIILWVIWKTLENQFDEAFDQFEKWGIKGIKVDFMQRDDQWMVNYHERVAREAAKRKMLVDFHGGYVPKGLRRAYPNVITRESVKGLEHNKWSDHITPEHNLILPFTRMVAGPMDFTPGAMVNAQKENFRIAFNRPMSQGTRCHQLAMYVVYESPLQMLADSPSNYLREKECLAFLSRVPTVWDETLVLDAKVSDYILVARRSGSEWYIGAMTDWTPRKLQVNFSFLKGGPYQMDVYMDGPNAAKWGSDYQIQKRTVYAGDLFGIKLAPGGGWAARLYR